MKIKINNFDTYSGYTGYPETSKSDKVTIVNVIYEENEKPLRENSQSINGFPISLLDRKEIDKILLEPGISGHIPFHDWLKDNRNDFFKNNITDADPSGLVVKILEELQVYFDINSPKH